MASSAPLYQLKITLNGLRPPVWRRVIVRSDILLPKLHDVIQVVMGWHDCHLHIFEVDGEGYGVPEGMDDYHNEQRVRLSRLISAEKDKMRYEYDFGDSWIHTILLEKILPAGAVPFTPVCTAGKRACPPEDCGGIWGYASLLEALADPGHEEHDAMVEWMCGEEFDPEACDIVTVNARLKNV